VFSWWISKVCVVFGWVSIPIRMASMWFGLKGLERIIGRMKSIIN